MTLPLIKIATISELKILFGWNDELKHHQNVKVLGEKFLIHTLKQNGYNFDFTIVRQAKGKPYFQYNNKVHFSISDSKEYVAIVIHNKRIGIDIEYLRENKIALAKRFFNVKEVEYLNRITKDKIDKAFTQLWTIKEAYVKMTGTGIAGNFSTIDLSPEEYKENQDFYKNNHRIIFYKDPSTGLFVSICIE